MREFLPYLYLFALVVLVFFVGRVFAFFGALPHIGYLLSGYLFSFYFPQQMLRFMFLLSIPIFLSYLGFIASSKRLFSTPFQLAFVHPLRIAVGFSVFFIFLYFLGLTPVSAALISFLLSTSSSLILRWGRGTSYDLIERSFISFDALLSGLALLYVFGEPLTSVALTAFAYLLLLRTDSYLLDALVLVFFSLLPGVKVTGMLPLAFLVGVIIHRAFHRRRMEWVEVVFHEVLPLVFLFGVSLLAQRPFSPFIFPMFLVIALLSFIQNFISLVILGPLFGISPKTGAHILVRTFGPSEAVLFALFFVSVPSDLILAVFVFYAFSLVISSFVKTEKDAEHFLSVFLPRFFLDPIERLESAYASLFVRHHVIFSDAYRNRMRPHFIRVLTAAILLLLSIGCLVYLVFDHSMHHWAAMLIVDLLVLVFSLKSLISSYFIFYEETLLFISEHAYSNRLRPGKSPYYLVAGYILVVAAFLSLPVSIPVGNLVFLFFSLLILNIGLYMLLSSYARIYSEFVRRREYTP